MPTSLQGVDVIDPELSVFVISPPGFEDLLEEELNALELAGVRRVEGGVEFCGGWSEVYRANLFSRVATRVLARIDRFRARTFARFRTGLESIDWRDWLPAGCDLDLRITARRSRLYHTGRLEQECAAVLAERLGATVAAAGGARVRLQIRLFDDEAVVSVDTSGEPLYRRGYRTQVGVAPLRENLAASLLSRAGWRASEPLLDPFCGSGVFLIEAARLAAGIAPGQGREFSFQLLPAFDPTEWRMVQEEQCVSPCPCPRPAIFGSDRDRAALQLTARSARAGGVADTVQVAQAAAGELEPPAAQGLLIANPPYGRRLGHAESAYRELGELLRGPFRRWRWAVIVPDRRSQEALALRPTAAHPFLNGGLHLRFLIGQARQP